MKHLKNGDDVLSALCKAIQKGHLPNLNYLDFHDCSFMTEGILRYLFGSRTPALEHLDLRDLELCESDLQFMSELRLLSLSLSTGPFLQTETVQHLFQNQDRTPNHRKWWRAFSCLIFLTRIFPQCTNAWASLIVLDVTHTDSEFLEEFVRAVNENKFLKLEELYLSNGEYVSEKLPDISLLKLQAQKLPSLKCLCLTGFIFSGVQNLTKRLVKWDLKYLWIMRSNGIGGNLSVLLCHKFPSLESLDLSECELNSDDMRYLTEAKDQGKLPKLEHLNVSRNKINVPEMWIENEAWKNVGIFHHNQKEVPSKQHSDSDSDFLWMNSSDSDSLPSAESYSDSLGFEDTDSKGYIHVMVYKQGPKSAALAAT